MQQSSSPSNDAPSSAMDKDKDKIIENSIRLSEIVNNQQARDPKDLEDSTKDLAEKGAKNGRIESDEENLDKLYRLMDELHHKRT